MISLTRSEQFQCCLLMEDGTIFIGNTLGKVFEAKLMDDDEISKLEFEASKNSVSVLRDDLNEILKVMRIKRIVIYNSP